MIIQVPREPGKSVAKKLFGHAIARERMHRAAAIVEDCAILLSGRMTDWEEKPRFAIQWMFTEVRIDRHVVPVGVSGGGVIQVNRSRNHPETGEVITNTYQALTALMYHMRAMRGMTA